jgi:N-acetylmuramoyl-L-alanine amidase
LSQIRLIDAPSPSFDERRVPIDILLVHYTGMESMEGALARLRDPEARVSAHYLIDEGGAIYRLVPEEKRAWHAGRSFWAGERDVNSASIGVELANPGHEWGYRPFPEAQMAAFEALARDVIARHSISPRRVLGHSDVAPRRKWDPGEYFDWARLARAGIGLWPKPGPFAAEDHTFEAGDRAPEIQDAQVALARIGYEVEATSAMDEGTDAVLRAFQRRYRQSRVDGRLDPETAALIDAVLAL